MYWTEVQWSAAKVFEMWWECQGISVSCTHSHCCLPGILNSTWTQPWMWTRRRFFFFLILKKNHINGRKLLRETEKWCESQIKCSEVRVQLGWTLDHFCDWFSVMGPPTKRPSQWPTSDMQFNYGSEGSCQVYLYYVYVCVCVCQCQHVYLKDPVSNPCAFLHNSVED